MSRVSNGERKNVPNVFRFYHVPLRVQVEERRVVRPGAPDDEERQLQFQLLQDLRGEDEDAQGQGRPGGRRRELREISRAQEIGAELLLSNLSSLQKLWAISDLVMSVLISKTTNFELKEFPAQVRSRN